MEILSQALKMSFDSVMCPSNSLLLILPIFTQTVTTLSDSRMFFFTTMAFIARENITVTITVKTAVQIMIDFFVFHSLFLAVILVGISGCVSAELKADTREIHKRGSELDFLIGIDFSPRLSVKQTAFRFV